MNEGCGTGVIANCGGETAMPRVHRMVRTAASCGALKYGSAIGRVARSGPAEIREPLDNGR
jgi:hypothetical protein